MFVRIVIMCLCFVIGCVRARDRKNCFCQAVDATTSETLHDWGSIRTHSHWLHVSCRRLRGCRDDCNSHINDWVRKNPTQCQGKNVRAKYHASVCERGLYPEVIRC
ncbi:hypothetical protein KUTeg_021570 [Tegillarca granosa]|uniref:Secreted protein n=1 Tax=Tegillarca granosa TaxID=220873 RepID=A0ABQ9E3N6_TEGGR|nr:hypothetical protein KUTeg_021570 [Tegillarca granosa]